VDVEVLRGPREVPPVAEENPGDEPLLEFPPGVDEEDPAIHHLSDQRLQLLLHEVTLPRQTLAAPLAPPVPL
jgi:hypothetical protein